MKPFCSLASTGMARAVSEKICKLSFLGSTVESFPLAIERVFSTAMKALCGIIYRRRGAMDVEKESGARGYVLSSAAVPSSLHVDF